MKGSDTSKLEAMKAGMLRNLQAAEAIGQPDAPTFTMPPPPAPGSTAPPRPSGAAPTPQVATTGTVPAPAAGLGEAPVGVLAGMTPEQREEYRRKCWKQYYEYCALYQKYYDKDQQKGGGTAVYRPPLGGAPPRSALPAGPLPSAFPTIGTAPSTRSVPSAFGAPLGRPPAAAQPVPNLGVCLPGVPSLQRVGVPRVPTPMARPASVDNATAAALLVAARSRLSEEDLNTKLLGL